MAALHIRDVPEPVVASLRERARRHGRSVREEILRILEEVAAEPLPEEDLPPLQLTTVQTGGTSTWTREEAYDDKGR